MVKSKDLGPNDLGALEQQVAAIFELPDPAQAAAFAKLRQRHPRAASLLIRWERAAGELDAAERSMPSVSTNFTMREAAPKPDRIGPYRILDVLGEGGMGIVYLAEQQEPVLRRVALKVIRAGLDGSDVLARFEAERQAVAVMTHPNIAKVLEAGATEDGRPYFALEHVPGVPLTEYSDRQRLDLRERVELFQKVCAGVQHAHQKGIIHRDLKPGNILVQVRDGFAEPKIIDFGVAKATQQRLTERTLYTEQGRVLGTPEYMSPEQAEMSGLDIDTRSDIYSLGVLLYELLTGKLPFDSSALRRAGYFEMQRKIREDEPPRPSTRCSTMSDEAASMVASRRRMDPSGLSRALHGDLDWIVMRCLEKDPARRYPTASELAADLQRYLDDEPVDAGPPSAGYRFRKLLRKHRGPITAAAAVIVALALGLSLALWQWAEARASATTAGANEQLAKEATRHATDSLQLREAEVRKFRSLSLVAASDRVMDNDPVVALRLALCAFDTHRSPETIGQIQRAMSEQFLVARYEGHTKPVSCADHGVLVHRVVTGSDDGSVRVYREDGELLAHEPQGGRVIQVGFSADEQRILAVVDLGRRRVARILGPDGRLQSELSGPFRAAHWDPATDRLLVQRSRQPLPIAILDASGRELRQLTPGSKPVKSLNRLRFSPEGHAIHVEEHACTIWRADGTDPISLRLPGAQSKWTEFWVRSDHADCIAFDPLKELIVSAHKDRKARVWSVRGELLFALEEHTYRVNGVQFSPTGKSILTASGDGSVRIWDRSGRRQQVLTVGGEVARARYFGADERIVMRSGYWSDRGLRVTPLTGRGRIADLEPRDGLILTFQDNHARLYRLAGAETMHLRCRGSRPLGYTEHADGEFVASSDRGRVFAWDRTGRVTREFESGSDGPLYGVTTASGGTRLLAGGAHGMIYVWDWQSRKMVSAISVGDNEITMLAALPTGKLWAVSPPGNQVYVVDPETKESRAVEARFTDDARHLVAVHASPDGKLVMVARMGTGSFLLFDPTGKRLVEFKAHDRALTRFDFHPDGQRILTASSDGTVKLWNLDQILTDPKDTRPAHSFTPERPPQDACFAPDGEHLLITTGSRAYLTDLKGEVQFHFWPRERQHGYLPPACGFSRDGRWIVGKSFDGLRLWPAQEQHLLSVARTWADRLGHKDDLREFSQLLEPGEAGR